MRCLIASVLLGLAAAGHLHAQGAASYPSKPIRIIVPFSPGGPADMLARPLGQGLTEAWGHQVIVDHRAGAGGIVGAELLSKAAPDGYTVMITTQGIAAVNPSLHKRLPYDTLRDFVGVTNAVGSANIMVVHPSLPATTVTDVIRIARSRPGQMSYGSAGNGSASHLGTEMFKSMAKVNIVHVPYKGAAPGVTDLIGGHVQLMIIGIPVALPQVRAGKLKAIGVTTQARSPAAPDIPTLNESGLPGYVVLNWYGVLAPAKTPREIVAKLQMELHRILHAPEMKSRMQAQGMEPIANTPDEFDAHIRSELVRWAKVVKDAGLKPD
ncbi:MAG TPA: tripartite tricarboxylate transporter substrate binding protein [Burkholderiales bacterium]|nr:tripartite tricarboxylate transporter substrate binding protein [Burkholderiales bacterium]